jgi:hypothetical protein
VEEAARRASETANKDLRVMLDKANDLRERERCNFEGLMADKERELEAAEGSAERWRMAEESSKRLVASLERDGDAREERCWVKVERWFAAYSRPWPSDWYFLTLKITDGDGVW